MVLITKIVAVKKRKDYFTTVALTDHHTADEVEGFGKDYKVGDRVEVWFDDRYHKAKMRPYESTRP